MRVAHLCVSKGEGAQRCRQVMGREDRGPPSCSTDSGNNIKVGTCDDDTSTQQSTNVHIQHDDQDSGPSHEAVFQSRKGNYEGTEAHTGKDHRGIGIPQNTKRVVGSGALADTITFRRGGQRLAMYR
jgi:hypothetical protein